MYATGPLSTEAVAAFGANARHCDDIDSLAAVLAGRKQVTEGAFSAEAVVTLAQRLGVAMPVAVAVDQLLNHGAALDATVHRLTAAFGG